MARGESPRSTPRSPALVIGAFAAVACLGALFVALQSMRGCQPEPPPPPTTPFSASPALAALGWRDCVSAPVSLGDLQSRLQARGYVAAGEEDGARELPFAIAPAPLAGACGLVVARVEGTGRLDSSRAGSQARLSGCHESIIAAGTCGGAEVRFEGLGRARVHYFAVPGLDEAAASATGLPPDVLLALAEAEALLGWAPATQVWSREIAAADVRRVEPGPAPASGCTPFVTVALGLGRPQSLVDGVVVGTDFAPDHALVGGVACAGAASQLVFEDPGGDGGHAWSLAFSITAAGPALPGAPRASRASSLRASDAIEGR